VTVALQEVVAKSRTQVRKSCMKFGSKRLAPTRDKMWRRLQWETVFV